MGLRRTKWLVSLCLEKIATISIWAVTDVRGGSKKVGYREARPWLCLRCRSHCRKSFWRNSAGNHIRKLSLFGSVLTPRFRSDSDVDVLVEFEPGAAVSYFDLAAMELELGRVIGRKVDVRTPEELSR